MSARQPHLATHSLRCNRFIVAAAAKWSSPGLEHLAANEGRLEGYLECFMEPN